MKNQRGLKDAIQDPLVDKLPVKPTGAKRKAVRYVGTTILLALVLGFAGGLAVSRWMRMIC